MEPGETVGYSGEYKVKEKTMIATLPFGFTDGLISKSTVGKSFVLVGGEISTSTFADVDAVTRRVIANIGYDKPELGFNYHDCAVISTIKE